MRTELRKESIISMDSLVNLLPKLENAIVSAVLTARGSMSVRMWVLLEDVFFDPEY